MIEVDDDDDDDDDDVEVMEVMLGECEDLREIFLQLFLEMSVDQNSPKFNNTLLLLVVIYNSPC